MLGVMCYEGRGLNLVDSGRMVAEISPIDLQTVRVIYVFILM